MRKLNKVVAVLLGVITVMSLTGCNKDPSDSDDPGIVINENTVVVIKDAAGNHSIEYEASTREFVCYTNSEEVLRIVDLGYSKNTMMELPNDSMTDSLNGQHVITENVYASTTRISKRYLNYLSGLGYMEEFRADTSDFIEVYMKSPDGVYKRIIITETYIVMYDTDNIPEMEFQNYLFD